MSRRPLLAPAVALAAGIAIGLSGAGFPRGGAPLLATGLVPRLAPIAFACAGWIAAHAGRAVPAAPPAGPAEVRGRIASVPTAQGDRVHFVLRTDAGALLDASAAPAAWPLALGDVVRLRAELRAPTGPRNPGARDPAGRLAAEGIALQAFGAGPVVRVAPPSPAAWLERGRERLAEATRGLPAREAGVIRAIAAGDRGGLDPATTTSFARSGLAHVLAVSGLHLVVVAFGIERLLRALLLRADAGSRLAAPHRISAAAAIPVTLLYAVATGAGVPVLRAAMAAATIFAGALLDREPDAGNTLALAALAILAADPGAALDPSLQLSFAAVAGLVLWSGPLRAALPIPRPPAGTWRARLLEPLLAGACATVAASLATAPVLAYHFRQIPLLGVLANIPAIPVGSALTAAGAVAGIAAAVSPALAAPVLAIARPLATALVRLSDATAAPSWATLGVASPGVAGCVVAYVLALAAGRTRGVGRTALAAAAACALLAPGPLRAAAARLRGGLEVVFISVGQGDAALLRLPDGSAVLVDAGGTAGGGPDPGARDVVPLLRDLGVRRIAAVFLSHPHPDHALGLAAVASAFRVERLFTNGDPGDDASRAALEGLPPAEALAPGDRWTRAGVVFEIQGGARDALLANDASLVLRVRYGEAAFLFPGDVEEAGEAAAVARGGLRADVVKVPHHGSRRSSTAAFVAAVGARVAVVSVARENRYGFPHAEAVARWTGAGAVVLRTDDGALRFLSDGRTVRRVPASSALDPLATARERP